MKTTIIFLSVIVLSMLVGTISAQQGPPPGGPPQRQGQFQRMTPEETAKAQVEWMKTELKLDQAAQTKVYDVILKYSKQGSEARQKMMAEGNREGMRARMEEINAARDKELKTILGDKTFELFKTKEAERRQAMRPPRPN
jgi:hypothetical protein